MGKYKDKGTEILDRFSPLSSYEKKFKNRMESEITCIRTGYKELDIMLRGGLRNELCILGAETSTGKSAFVMSMAQNMAMSGVEVLYFSLEMGTDEYVARGISMISFEQKIGDASVRTYQASDLLGEPYDEETGSFAKIPYVEYGEYAREYFARYGQHLHIIEDDNEGFTAQDVADICGSFRTAIGDRPIVAIIDYLQILKDDGPYKSDRKAKMDSAAAVFKELALRERMPVIAISSVSRANYGSRVKTSSYKESGDLEYTGGLLLGWNENAVDATGSRVKGEECRSMILEVIKSRNAEKGSSVLFDYYPAYSYFEETFEPTARPMGGNKVLHM